MFECNELRNYNEEEKLVFVWPYRNKNTQVRKNEGLGGMRSSSSLVTVTDTVDLI